ncbi:MAG: DUF2062 domain-containing protein [Verrucomicrobiota bacterium]|nr:DUF2062 domain-containing protein [Verrucomicrobiota bacterium]
MSSQSGMRTSAARRLWGRASRRLLRLVSGRDSAARMARGAAAGFFAAAIPLPGLQIPLSLLFAWIARGNKTVAPFPQLASNALTMAPQAFLQFRIGALLWPGQTAEIDQAVGALRTILTDWQWSAAGRSLANLRAAVGDLGLDVLGPLILGVLVTGVGAALLSYPTTVVLVWTWRAWRRSRRLRRAARTIPVEPLILPPPLAPPPAPTDPVARYARYPARFQYASAARLLVDGREAYPEMLAAIGSAAATVDLETYIFRADRVGARFQDALIRAAHGGARVRLLYDYIGSLGLPECFVHALTEAGVEVAVYNPLVWTRPLWAINRRDHRKILVVDRRTAFTGGLNISDDYDSAAASGGEWRDTHIRLDGADVAQAAERLFEQGWRQAIPYAESATPAARLKARARRRLRSLVIMRQGEEHGPDTTGAPSGAGNVPVHIIGNKEFRCRLRIHRAYLRAIRRAQRYILIENAYFIPNRPVRRALARAARRGVLVIVAVARQSDVTFAAYAGRNLYSELLSCGVRIFEWPHSMLHAKTAVIDDAWAIVGSYNFDHRSFVHQLEAVAVVADPALASCLREQTMTDLAQCREVTLSQHESRSWRAMLLESGAYALRYWL